MPTPPENHINEGTLKISSNSMPTKVKIKSPEDNSNLTISASGAPSTLSVKDAGTTGTLGLNAVYISDLSLKLAETETLPFGEKAYVKNLGNTKNAILKFGLPAGNGIAKIELIKTEGLVKTYRITFTNGETFDYQVVDGSGASVSWGTILGNIENQADLKNALDSKADDSAVVKTINHQEPIDGNIDISVTGGSFTYEQGVASDTWIVTHNLNKHPSVSVTDSANNIVDCSVEYTSLNTCTLRMNGAFKGYAYFN